MHTPSRAACMVRAAPVARRGVALAVPSRHPCEPGDRSCIALEMATEAVELLLECMTALSNRALHKRQTTLPTEVVQSWSECEMLLSTEEIEPWSVCETTLPTEALPQ